MSDATPLAKNDYLSTFLSDIEKEKIVQFYNDPIMREGVKKVLLAGLYRNGTLRPDEAGNPLVNAAFSLAASRGEFSNEQIGQDLRALWEGVNALEAAFGQLSKFKVEDKPRAEKPINKAR